MKYFLIGFFVFMATIVLVRSLDGVNYDVEKVDNDMLCVVTTYWFDVETDCWRIDTF